MRRHVEWSIREWARSMSDDFCDEEARPAAGPKREPTTDGVRVPEPASWRVVLDLGLQRNATELDALCLEATLHQAGVDARFYPWHPACDVLTPLGAVRPLQLVVPAGQLDEASELARSVLAGAPERREVLVPINDAWVLPYYVGVLVSHIVSRSRERGGSWTIVHLLLKAYAASMVLGVFAGIVQAAWQLANQAQ